MTGEDLYIIWRTHREKMYQEVVGTPMRELPWERLGENDRKAWDHLAGELSGTRTRARQPGVRSRPQPRTKRRA